VHLLHWAFESLAYVVAYAVYGRIRARAGDPIDDDRRTWVIVAAIIGAALGSKLLAMASGEGFVTSGKTIVGGLIGGWVAVEIAKARLGVRTRTGDLFAIPLCIGIGIGRIGCWLDGVSDKTYGSPTTLAWGIDLGDGILRHPVQPVEIVFLIGLALFLRMYQQRPHRMGDAFRVFMIGYMGFRFGIEFLKPGSPIAGLTPIQWACAATALYSAKEFVDG
jgi:phosphatidylglycerol:prolipoprotein diacylglycerol transferase